MLENLSFVMFLCLLFFHHRTVAPEVSAEVSQRAPALNKIATKANAENEVLHAVYEHFNHHTLHGWGEGGGTPSWPYTGKWNS